MVYIFFSFIKKYNNYTNMSLSANIRDKNRNDKKARVLKNCVTYIKHF